MEAVRNWSTEEHFNALKVYMIIQGFRNIYCLALASPFSILVYPGAFPRTK